MSAPAPLPSAIARGIREHLARGGATLDALPRVRELVSLSEDLFQRSRRDPRMAEDDQLAGTLEGTQMILDMLRGLESSLGGKGSTPANLLSFLAFAEKALRAQELAVARLASRSSAAPARPAAVPRGRALLVEDEEAFLRVAGAWLREAGFEVIEVTRADVARPLLAEERWDLLFTDMVLPGGGDGFDLATHALAANIGVAIVFASGYTPRSRPPELRSWPMLTKPFRRVDLLGAVDQALALASPSLPSRPAAGVA